MNTLTINFHPFTVGQEIDVHMNDGITIKDFAPLDEIINKINMYCSTIDIDKIYLCGNRNFVSKYYNELITNYAYDAKEIHIVEK